MNIFWKIVFNVAITFMFVFIGFNIATSYTNRMTATLNQKIDSLVMRCDSLEIEIDNHYKLPRIRDTVMVNIVNKQITVKPIYKQNKK